MATTKRFAALAILCLVVAPVTAKARSSSAGMSVTLQGGVLAMNNLPALPIIVLTGDACPFGLDSSTAGLLRNRLGADIVVDESGACLSQPKDQLEASLGNVANGPLWLYELKRPEVLDGLSVLVDWQAPVKYVDGNGAVINCVVTSAAPQFDNIHAAVKAGETVVGRVAIGGPADRRICITAQGAQALTYLSVEAGAKAMEFLVYNLFNKDEAVSLRPEMLSMAGGLMAKLKGWQKYLLGPKRSLGLTGGTVRGAAYTYNNTVLVLVTNTEPQSTNASIAVKGMTKNTVILRDGKRFRPKLVKNAFRDKFAGFTTHAYQLSFMKK
jgi:hypothetical protein